MLQLSTKCWKEHYQQLGYPALRRTLEGIIKTKKKKLIPISNLEKYAWKEFSKYIRTRDCLKTTGTPEFGCCYTCGERHSFADLDAGHFVKSTHKAVKFREENVHSQCSRCNTFLGGNEGVYAEKLGDEYGFDMVKELNSHRGEIHKFTRDELEELRKYYKVKTEELWS